MLEKEGDDSANLSGEMEDGTSLTDTGGIAENSHSNLDSQSDSMFQMQADDRAHVIININSLSQTDAVSIAVDFRSYLYSQLEMPGHVSINTNTLVEITAMGDRGNQETEAGNPHVDYGLSSHVNSEVFPLVDSSVNDDRNEEISQIDGHDRHQVFPQVDVFISYEGDRGLINMFLAELERKNIKVHQGNDENEEGSSGGSLGVDSMIERSVAAVIIFSEKYPFSVKRLKELVKIIEWSYAGLFRDYEFDYGIEQVESWRNALREASDSESENLIIVHRKLIAMETAKYV
ncbi:hypothetical protein L6164_026235 [Bauhinia variegata]|uniref:Uncharacterized protein n=1 Tax=Bauhinia variegata TaxID=167791 RepID=A0ACB9LQG4_BAUVA|nr:hypothetical protein L6164_026235 [Bauhinia variegata]